jgi:MFS family permease
MSTTLQPPSTARAHHTGFWLTAAAFLINMGFSAVPTPLYGLYEQRDHFSSLIVTVVYAVYAVGVIASLFLAGHLSDRFGRKRILIPALLIDVVSAGIFILFPSLAGLLIARVVNGVSVGLTTATATSYLLDLHRRHRPEADTRRADVVAAAANLGGIGFGPLVSGFLLQYAGNPLRLSYYGFGIVLVVLAGLLSLIPETVTPPDPMPRYRPQTVAVPADARVVFFAAVAAGMASFAVFGVFNSLAPSFLIGSLHNSSHFIAGIVAFSAFASAAVGQIAQIRSTSRQLLIRSLPVIVVGLGLLTGGMWDASLAMFIAGGVITGVGGGMVFKGALVTAAQSAPADRRAEVLAGYFLGAYVGLSIPVIALGVAVQYWAAKDVMLVFVVVAIVAMALAVREVLNRTAPVAQPGIDRPVAVAAS